ncbi:hypothetical protein Btru_023633 [Bulinus truncatus]|nr:hypothetical protein Btru_023633 [Bulinus truncatus]
MQRLCRFTMTTQYTRTEVGDGDDPGQEETGDSDSRGQEDEAGDSDWSAQEDGARNSDGSAQEDEAGDSDGSAQEDGAGDSDGSAQEDGAGDSDGPAQEDGANTQVKEEESVSGVPYDKGWAWMVSVSFFWVNYVYLCFDQAISVLLVDIMDELDTTVSVISVMLAMNAGFYCLAILLANGVLLQHMTHRTLETAAAVINALATIMFVVQPTVPFFHISSFIKASAKGSSIIASLLFLTQYFREKRNIALAIGLSGSSVCALTVSPLSRYLKDEYGLRGCFLILAGIELHAVVATLFLRPISSYRARRPDFPERSAAVKKDGNMHLLKLQETPSIAYTDGPIANLETGHRVQIYTWNEVNQPGRLKVLPDLTGDKDSKDVLMSDALKEGSDLSGVPTTAEDITSSLIAELQENIDPGVHIATKIDNRDNKGQEEQNFQEIVGNRADNVDVDGNKLVNKLTKCDQNASHVTIVNPEQIKIKDDHDASLKDYDGEHMKVFLDGTYVNVSFHNQTKDTLSLNHVQGSKKGINPLSARSCTNRCQCLKNCLEIFLWDKVNFSLLTNFACMTIFSIYCLGSGGLLTSTYLPTFATRAGLAPARVPDLFIILGSCEIASRIVSALLSDYEWVPFKKIMGVSVLGVGGVCQFMGVSSAHGFFIFYAVVKGLLGGVVTLLSTELIIHTLGHDNLLAVKVMCSLCLCVYVGVQHLVIGALIRYTDQYVVAFHYVGAMYLLGFVLLLLLPYAEKLQKVREEKKTSNIFK